MISFFLGVLVGMYISWCVLKTAPDFLVNFHDKYVSPSLVKAMDWIKQKMQDISPWGGKWK
jgi:hypothetical protein